MHDASAVAMEETSTDKSTDLSCGRLIAEPPHQILLLTNYHQKTYTVFKPFKHEVKHNKVRSL